MCQHFLSVESDLPGGWLQESGQNAHQGRLARPVGPQEAEHAVGQIETDALQRGDGAGIDLHQIANQQHDFGPPNRVNGRISISGEMGKSTATSWHYEVCGSVATSTNRYE